MVVARILGMFYSFIAASFVNTSIMVKLKQA